MKKISKTFKFRLTPTQIQKESFEKWTGCCRFLYNCALDERIQSYLRDKRKVSEYDQSNQLKIIKKDPELSFFKEVPAQCLQQTLKDLNRAYQSFFRGGGFPKFKSKTRSVNSFRFPDPKQFKIEKLNRSQSRVKLPKVGWVKFRQSQSIEGRIRNATVIKNQNHWSICFNCEVELKIVKKEGSSIGLDRGVKLSVVGYTSDDQTKIYKLPSNIEKLEKRRSTLQKRLRLKKKFSNNWKKYQKKISQISSKIAKIRLDFNHKVSHDLSKNHALIIMENLKTKNMIRSAKGTIERPGRRVKAKSGLNRVILRQGWYQLERMLEYKSEWYGSELRLVKPHHSSQECSSCGYTSPLNRKSQEKFLCLKCKTEMNADENAAINILTRGRRGSVCGDAVIRPIYEAEISVAL